MGVIIDMQDVTFLSPRVIRQVTWETGEQSNNLPGDQYNRHTLNTRNGSTSRLEIQSETWSHNYSSIPADGGKVLQMTDLVLIRVS